MYIFGSLSSITSHTLNNLCLFALLYIMSLVIIHKIFDCYSIVAQLTIYIVIYEEIGDTVLSQIVLP